MVKMSEEKDITPILSKYKKIYFMSYNFILFFTVTNNKHYIFFENNVQKFLSVTL